ncbi:MAG: glyoxalase/bleomycin resistance/extradiol dioxygenase family protein [Thermoanaerobaculia bacterium]|nr:glyoxalase/bleomycin resistance/extradiol dioxygenase family protein [Thermoanaerobaculia bacterium]
MQIQPYLFFQGRCEEALEFYHQALGAKVEMLKRMKEIPEGIPTGNVAPGSEEKIMHGQMRIGESVVMASDGSCNQGPTFGGFSLSISLEDEAAADRAFAALAQGGSVEMPMGETFWSPRFGMVTDRFGVGWMINVDPAAS